MTSPEFWSMWAAARSAHSWIRHCSAEPNSTDLLQREHPRIVAGIGMRQGKLSIFGILAAVSLKRCQIESKLPSTTNRNALSIGTNIDDLEWLLSSIECHWFLKCRKNGYNIKSCLRPWSEEWKPYRTRTKHTTKHPNVLPAITCFCACCTFIG